MRILFYDIETTHNIVAVFALYGEDYINPDNLLQERYIISAAWKWAGEKKVSSVATTDDRRRYTKNPHDDYHVVKTLYDAVASADVIVAHNGDKFDLRYLATRALAHGLPPLPPVQSIDTLKVAKARFKFNSNRLTYLGKFLGLGEKLDTSKGLWLRVLRGEAAAVKEMVAYNKQDVLLLEAVFNKLKPYVKIRLECDGSCPRCGSERLQSRGVYRTAAKEYQRFRCQDCGGWTSATKSGQRVR